MEQTLHERFQQLRDDLGIAINKVSEKIEVDTTKMYNFVAGSSLKNEDAIKLHEFLKSQGY